VIDSVAAVYVELWVSLASLLRSYTSIHGLSGNREAELEWDEAQIRVRSAEKWLNLQRDGSRVTWMRENGESGALELTEAGQLRGTGTGGAGEEEMDMAAEAWARELMR
jgi:hypothetical protein